MTTWPPGSACARATSYWPSATAWTGAFQRRDGGIETLTLALQVCEYALYVHASPFFNLSYLQAKG
jgi:hypothetical protein